MLEEIEICTILMVDFKSFMDRRSFFVHVDLNVELNNEDLHSHFSPFHVQIQWPNAERTGLKVKRSSSNEYGQSNWEAS